MATDTAELRRRSAALFGNEKMVEVVLALDSLPEPRTATAQVLAAATGISHSMVRDVLIRLAAAGLLTSVPKVGGSRSAQYYQPRDGWETLVELARSTQAIDRVNES